MEELQKTNIDTYIENTVKKELIMKIIDPDYRTNGAKKVGSVMKAAFGDFTEKGPLEIIKYGAKKKYKAVMHHHRVLIANAMKSKKLLEVLSEIPPEHQEMALDFIKYNYITGKLQLNAEGLNWLKESLQIILRPRFIEVKHSNS